VPQRFREKLGSEFVLTVGFGQGKHIRVYPMSVWSQFEEQLVSADVHDEYNTDLVCLQRTFGNAEFASYDQQNRLSIPRFLREFAGLQESGSAVIVGTGPRLEIWSREVYDRLFANLTEQGVLAAAESDRQRANSQIQADEPRADMAPTQASQAPMTPDH